MKHSRMSIYYFPNKNSSLNLLKITKNIVKKLNIRPKNKTLLMLAFLRREG